MIQPYGAEYEYSEWWYCECRRHSYSPQFVRQYKDAESDCRHCGTGPVTLYKTITCK